MRILHVVESYGAGTASAVQQYVHATSQLSHHLVRRLRNDDDHVDDGELAAFDSVSEMSPGTLAAVRSVRDRIRSLQPDVVHAHSSFGGAFARLAVGRRPRPLVVYTPHCFATERQDLRPAERRAYATAERLLGRRTDVYAGCSTREVALARRFGPRARHVFVPNITDVGPVHGDSEVVPYLAGMGRLAPQRDPQLFADTVTRLRELHGPMPARWIGGGDPALAALLRDRDIEVTGWMPRSAALDLLGRAAVYLHTAAWDGAPMTVIEARALGLPIVARRTPALADAPAAELADDSGALAEIVAKALAGDREANLAGWAAYLAGNTVERQRETLLEAYAVTAT